jgi:threonine dehydrogenase-like Zn-dependent dehydrogenase
MSADESWTFDAYREGTTSLPDPNLGWNTYGRGIENVGVDGRPEPIEISEPAANQLLVRVDAVGLCFSDVKLIRLGGDHPKLYGRDLSVEPTRLGHEATVTVIKVGADLADDYQKGQRLAIQPDIHVDGRSTAYGYTIPGGLIQYHLLGPEVLDADDGAYVIPVSDDLGYASAALSEPWACVEAAYTQRRRLWPLAGGVAWVIVDGVADAEYDFGDLLKGASTLIVTGGSDAFSARIASAVGGDTTVVSTDALEPSAYAALSQEHTGGAGFDDTIVLDPRSADVLTEAAKLIAFRGTMAMVGEHELDDFPEIDFGRLHYDYTAYLGARGTDVSAAYGEERNRCDLREGGLAAFVGAAGPMGQMHIQRAIENADGPKTIIAIDTDDDRMSSLLNSLVTLAESRGRTLIPINPMTSEETPRELIDRLTDGRGADDVVVSVPVAPVMADAGTLLASDGMLVFFAGIANGTMGPLDISRVYLDNAQFTGTSGSAIHDQAAVLEKASAGTLSPSLNLAAIGGIDAGRQGIEAVLSGTFAGKVVIFPQVEGVPLTGLTELADTLPDVAAALGAQGEWTDEAERILIESYSHRG